MVTTKATAFKLDNKFTRRQLYKNVDKAIANYNNRKHNSLQIYEASLQNNKLKDRVKMEIYTDRVDPFDKNQLLIQLHL